MTSRRSPRIVSMPGYTLHVSVGSDWPNGPGPNIPKHAHLRPSVRTVASSALLLLVAAVAPREGVGTVVATGVLAALCPLSGSPR